jgi:hypothetical protein
MAVQIQNEFPRVHSIATHGFAKTVDLYEDGLSDPGPVRTDSVNSHNYRWKRLWRFYGGAGAIEFLGSKVSGSDRAKSKTARAELEQNTANHPSPSVRHWVNYHMLGAAYPIRQNKRCWQCQFRITTVSISFQAG